jgi:hypothetical protein
MKNINKTNILITINLVLIGLISLFGISYSAGWHTAEEILSGEFKGEYNFTGDSVDFSQTSVSGVGGGLNPYLSNGIHFSLSDNKSNYHNYYKPTGNTVRDLLLGLEWEKSPSSTKRKYADAKTYCESLRKSGHSNWRLPTLVEMELSLIDTARVAPKIVGGNSLFSNIQTDAWYWTDTRYLSSSAGIVSFNNGRSDYNYLTDTHYVMCVRRF